MPAIGNPTHYELQSTPSPAPAPAHNIIWHGSSFIGEPDSYGDNLGIWCAGNKGPPYSTTSTGHLIGEDFILNRPEIWALDLRVKGADPTAAQVLQIVNDTNANNTDVTATAVTGKYADLFPSYDVVLTTTETCIASWFAWDFGRETNVSGTVVTEVGAMHGPVPEPASAGCTAAALVAALSARRRPHRRSRHVTA
jgi:hypothetical protein